MTDRQITDGRATAYSQPEFTFAKTNLGWSTDGSGLGLKFFKIILFQHRTMA